MVWSSHRLRWSYVCSSCGSNRDTGKRVFVVNAPRGSGLGPGDSPCNNEEYTSLKRELQERNSQRDDLLTKIKDLSENNKKYREHLDQRESSRRQQVHALQKTHTNQLSDRDHLIATLQSVIEDHERTIQQLELRLYGSSTSPIPTSSLSTHSTSSPFANTPAHNAPSRTPGQEATFRAGATARLIADIKLLHEEKSKLLLQLTEAKGQLEVCQLEHVDKIAALQKSLADRDRASSLQQDNKENVQQAANGDAGSCSTDTEKQLEKVQAENGRLAAEVSSLHRFYTRNPSLSFSPQAESQRRLEDENRELRRQLLSAQAVLQQREGEWGEEESEMRTRMNLLQSDKQCVERQLSLLQDPDVITRVVEVESEDLKTQVADLEGQVKEWETRCVDRDRTVADLHKQIEFLNDKVKKGEEEKQMLTECLVEEAEKERQSKELAVSDVRRAMEQQMYELRVAHQNTTLGLARMQSSVEGVRQAYIVLAHQARQFPQTLALAVKDVQQQMSQAIQNMAEENKDLVRKYHKEMRLRKKYHNELVELKGNIRVLCRVRPPIKEDGTGAQAEVVVTYDPDDDGLVYVSHKGRIQTYEFDRVFSPASSQTQVFDEVKALVTSCIDGFNVCIFAYGQTGSGKTFTMEGPDRDPGINQRALQELFAETADKGQDWQFAIEVSVMEIYNETIRDLLNSDSGNKMDVKMKGDGGGYHVPGLVTKVVTSVQEVNQVFAEGRRNRATATTNMNEHSSRSHCLLCVTVSGLNRTTSSRSYGRLNLVDLAGSERVSKSGADGARLREAQNINKSLACLGDVIHALRIKQSHIPYRNSKLTYLLQDSLGGDSKTLMIVQVAPVEKNVSETTCSLSFGQRVRNVELGPASRKVDTADVEAKSPTSPTSATGSPPMKRKVMSPRSSPATPAQSRFTPSKSSPASTRVLRQTSRR